MVLEPKKDCEPEDVTSGCLARLEGLFVELRFEDLVWTVSTSPIPRLPDEELLESSEFSLPLNGSESSWSELM